MKFIIWGIVLILLACFVAGKVLQPGEFPYSGTNVQLRAISDRIEEFKKTCGRYPLTEEGLAILVKNSKPDFCPNYPKEGFIENGQVPTNAWNIPFVYNSDGQTFEIYTFDDQDKKLIYDPNMKDH